MYVCMCVCMYVCPLRLTINDFCMFTYFLALWRSASEVIVQWRIQRTDDDNWLENEPRGTDRR